MGAMISDELEHLVKDREFGLSITPKVLQICCILSACKLGNERTYIFREEFSYRRGVKIPGVRRGSLDGCIIKHQ